MEKETRTQKVTLGKDVMRWGLEREGECAVLIMTPGLIKVQKENIQVVAE